VPRIDVHTRSGDIELALRRTEVHAERVDQSRGITKRLADDRLKQEGNDRKPRS